MQLVLFFIKRSLNRKKNLLFCFCIISFCFALVVITAIFSRSMIHGMQNKISYLSSGHLTVNADLETVKKVLDNSQEKELIDISDSVITGYGMIYTKEGNGAFSIKGIEEDYLEKRKEYLTYTFFEGNVKNKIIISALTAEKLNLKPGDKVAILVTNASGRAKVRPDVATVYGIYSSGFSEVDNALIYADYDYAVTLFPQKENRSSELIIKNYSSGKLETLERFLLNYFNTVNFMQANGSVYRTCVTSNQAIILILFLIIIVSSYSTMSSSEEIFFEQRKTLEVYKMLGAGRKQMFFSLAGLILGTIMVSCLCAFIVGVPLGCALPGIIKASGLGKESASMYLLDFSPLVPIGEIALLFFFQMFFSAIFVLGSLFSVFSDKSKIGIIKLQ